MMFMHVYFRLPLLMIAWGTMACLHATIKGFTSLALLRFLLGVFESGFFPVHNGQHSYDMQDTSSFYLGSDLLPYFILQEE